MLLKKYKIENNKTKYLIFKTMSFIQYIQKIVIKINPVIFEAETRLNLPRFKKVIKDIKK